MKTVFEYKKAESGYLVFYTFQPELITIPVVSEEMAAVVVDIMTRAFFAGALRASALIKFDTERMHNNIYGIEGTEKELLPVPEEQEPVAVPA